ncbi:MAG: DUF4404 family protein [Planctomycetota bacterium]
MAKRFHQATEQFADSHPGLFRTAGQVADTLAQMGI